MRLRLMTKMLLAFGVTSLLTALLGAFAFFGLDRITEPLRAIKDDTLPSLAALQTLTTALSYHRLSVVNLALLDDPALLPQQEIVIADANKRLQTALSDYKKQSEDQETTGQLEKTVDLYVKASTAVLDASRKNDKATLKTALESSRALYNVAVGFQEKIIALDTTQANRRSAEAQAAYSQSRLLLPAISLVVVAVSLLLGAFMARSISRPIRDLAESVRVVARGDLTQPDLAVRGQDEVADLARDINRMSGSLRTLLSRLRENVGQVAQVGASVSAGAAQTAHSVD